MINIGPWLLSWTWPFISRPAYIAQSNRGTSMKILLWWANQKLFITFHGPKSWLQDYIEEYWKIEKEFEPQYSYIRIAGFAMSWFKIEDNGQTDQPIGGSSST